MNNMIYLTDNQSQVTNGCVFLLYLTFKIALLIPRSTSFESREVFFPKSKV